MNGRRIHLPVLESTNIYTIALLGQSGIQPWTIVSTDYQNKGKGQYGRSWEVNPGENLTFSVAFKPEVAISEKFRISSLAMLSIVYTLKDFGIQAQIKWPNDILVDGRKIAGLLIENTLKDGKISWSVVGIGLNVNQTSFPDFPWPATSMKLENQSTAEFSLEEVLQVLYDRFKVSWNQGHDSIRVSRWLNDYLFARNEKVEFYDGKKTIEAVVEGILSDGRLHLSIAGEDFYYVNGEIRMIRTSS